MARTITIASVFAATLAATAAASPPPARWRGAPITVAGTADIGADRNANLAALQLDAAPKPWIYASGMLGVTDHAPTLGLGFHVRKIFDAIALSVGGGVTRTMAGHATHSSTDYFGDMATYDYSYAAATWVNAEIVFEARSSGGATFKLAVGARRAVAGGAYACTDTVVGGNWVGYTTTTSDCSGSSPSGLEPYAGLSIGFSPQLTR